MKKLRIDPDRADLADFIERGVLLHGHTGPFLIAGIRAGLLALKLLDHPGYFGIRAESEAGTEPPVSCFTDGIQIGSGCTIGKGNLSVIDTRLPRVRFTADDGKTVLIEIRDRPLRMFTGGEVEGEAERARSLPLEELFAWTGPSSA